MENTEKPYSEAFLATLESLSRWGGGGGGGGGGGVGREYNFDLMWGLGRGIGCV